VGTGLTGFGLPVYKAAVDRSNARQHCMRMVLSSKHGSGYRAYTSKFDREVRASEIDSVLGSLRHDQQIALDAAWEVLQTDLLPWRTTLHLTAADASLRIRSALTETERHDTAISLLFDQSGSMRGQKMLFAAATADVVQEFLLTLGMTCEVLGFTTSRWRGGRSRARWNWRFRPSNPGRLNDLLHVIYQDGGDRRASTGKWDYRQMLRPDLPKENIDGEAIQWAAHRLSNLPNKRKILIVLSDGAPVDDATLTENSPAYLGDHLREVVENIVAEANIRIAAMGVGYRVHLFYPASNYVEAPNELGAALITLIEQILTT
jgi:cobaltochelatase CobT